VAAAPSTTPTPPLGPPAIAPVATAAAASAVAADPTVPPANLGELHQADAPVSASAAALLAPGASTPLLARAFRAARAG
jgi:hypothetical protein